MTRDYFLQRLIVSFLLLFLAACNPAFTTEQQTYTLEDDDAVQARTEDGQNIDVAVTILFEIAPENLERVQINFPEGNYLEQYIRPVLRDEIRNIMSQVQAQVLYGLDIEESISPLETINNELEDAVRTELDKTGFTVTRVLIRMIDFDENFLNAMEVMQIATLTFRSYEDLQGTATQATINLRNAEASETATHTP